MTWDNIYNYIFVEMSALHCPKAFIILAVIFIIAATQAIKYPIKKFATSKIQNDVIRKKVNSAFVIIPVVLGVLVSYIYHCAFGWGFSHYAGGMFGLIAAISYEVIVRLLARAKAGENITGDVIAEDVANSTEAVTSDVLETLSTAAQAVKGVTQVVKAVGNISTNIVNATDTKNEQQSDTTSTATTDTSGGKLEEVINKLTVK
jgi:hypothetical protein